MASVAVKVPTQESCVKGVQRGGGAQVAPEPVGVPQVRNSAMRWPEPASVKSAHLTNLKTAVSE